VHSARFPRVVHFREEVYTEEEERSAIKLISAECEVFPVLSHLLPVFFVFLRIRASNDDNEDGDGRREQIPMGSTAECGELSSRRQIDARLTVPITQMRAQNAN